MVPPTPRWLLNLQASILRSSISILQTYFSTPIYTYYSHTPFCASHTLNIPSKTSPTPGTIPLIFYTPPLHSPNSPSQTSPNNSTKKQELLPCILNFHGGGFVIGTGIDDERWARTVVQELGAIVVSVEYRLAPQHTFPTAVQDGVDALLYVWEHAEELGIDRSRIVTSGFSAGGGLAITVPLMLRDVLAARREKVLGGERGEGGKREEEGQIRVKAVVAWYPGIDSTRSRETRIASMVAPQKGLSIWLTNIFDASYQYPSTLDLTNPYLSPGLAPDEILRESLPEDILMYTCEHDMLCEEGKTFAERLKGEAIGKQVTYRCVEGVPHAWDKGPNPHPRPEPIYEEACRYLKHILGDDQPDRVDTNHGG